MSKDSMSNSEKQKQEKGLAPREGLAIGYD